MPLESIGQIWNPITHRVHLVGKGESTVLDLSPFLPYPSAREQLIERMRDSPVLDFLLEGAPFPTVQAVIEAEQRGTTLSDLLAGVWEQAKGEGDHLEEPALAVEPDPYHAHLLACIIPPRALAFGVTYESSALEREVEGRKADYRYVYRSTRERGERCELFIKGSRPLHFFGPHGSMGLRNDLTNSRDTGENPTPRVPVLAGIEPELAAVTYSNGRILGYTLANDVSGNRIENESLLYLFQAKYFVAATGIGPWLWLSDEQDNPNLIFMVEVWDGEGNSRFRAEADSRRIGVPIRNLVAQAASHNPLFPGELFLTGTDVTPNEETKVIQPGWRVEIRSPQLGSLAHGAALIDPHRPANLDYHRLERSAQPR